MVTRVLLEFISVRTGTEFEDLHKTLYICKMRKGAGIVSYLWREFIGPNAKKIFCAIRHIILRRTA